MILNISLLEYHLLRSLEMYANEKGWAFKFGPSIAPSSNMFPNVPTDKFPNYVKYIHSTFRVDIDGWTFYFFFRNCRNKLDQTYTWPSSIEILRLENSYCSTVLKEHFFDTASGPGLLPNRTDPMYTDAVEMKQDIKKLSNEILTRFLVSISIPF